jgi:hypothetical protein
MSEPRKPAFRDGMPWWAEIVLVLARLASLVPFVLAIVLAVWLARGGTQKLPGMAKHAWQRVQAMADSTFR